jgi:hypothetical protein
MLASRWSAIFSISGMRTAPARSVYFCMENIWLRSRLSWKLAMMSSARALSRSSALVAIICLIIRQTLLTMGEGLRLLKSSSTASVFRFMASCLPDLAASSEMAPWPPPSIIPNMRSTFVDFGSPLTENSASGSCRSMSSSLRSRA